MGQGVECRSQKSGRQKCKKDPRGRVQDHKYKDFVEKEHPERTIDLLRAKWHTRDGQGWVECKRVRLVRKTLLSEERHPS